MIKKFLSYQGKRIKRYFQKDTKARIGVAVTMVAMISLLIAGIYILTVEGLTATQSGEDPFMTEATPLYIYQLFFLVIGFLVFVSTIIFGLFGFFQKEDDWIVASPEYESLASVKFLRSLIESSWPIMIIAFPLVGAVSSVFNLALIEVLLLIFIIIIFSFFCASLAINTIFLTSLIFRKFSHLSFSVITITALLGMLIWNRVIGVDLIEIFQVKEAIDPLLTTMKDNFSIFPSHSVAMTTYYMQISNIEKALTETRKVLLFFVATLTIFLILKSKFLIIWQKFQEGSFEAKNEREGKDAKILQNDYFPNSAEDAIRKKELLTNFRSPKNIFWLSFLTILMVIQVGVVNLLERYVGIGDSQELATAGITPGIQIGVILFFISAIILRFVFPSLSQEGKTSWIIGSVPLNFGEIFKAKYKFYSKLLLFISLISLLVYIVPLGVAVEIAIISISILFISTMVLVMLGLGMGALFINFETDDPQALSTSAPGVVLILSSIIYSGWAAYVAYSITQYKNYTPVILFLIISITIYKAIKTKALNALIKLEFT